MIKEIFKGIYQIKIPLPGNPLKALNSYLIKGANRNLLIDTGFNLPECKEAHLKALATLEVDWSELDFFITHMHGDHSGLVHELADKNSKIYCSQTDADLIRACTTTTYQVLSDILYIQNGYPLKYIINSERDSPSKWISRSDVNFTYVEEGDILDVGDYHLLCIATPGHSPGHMCLYEPEYKFLIAGDLILCDITPNIISWIGVDDSLDTYLCSLEKVKAMDISLILPGHREIIRDYHKRIFELKQHHEDRLKEILYILKTGPKNAYEVARLMNWGLSYNSFEKFPNIQKWFATGEAIAHLEHLAKLNKVQREQDGKGIFYKVRKTIWKAHA
jgi:glyoxylase-like metal-dependent hydrolase (beta-lactamase superfamily II)